MTRYKFTALLAALLFAVSAAVVGSTAAEVHDIDVPGITDEVAEVDAGTGPCTVQRSEWLGVVTARAYASGSGWHRVVLNKGGVLYRGTYVSGPGWSTIQMNAPAGGAGCVWGR